MKKSKKHDKAILDAYTALVEYRRLLEDKGDFEKAERIELIYKELWCETLNMEHPW